MNIIQEFRYLIPLDVSFYKTKPYYNTPIRRAKIMLIMGSMRNYEPFRKLLHEEQKYLVCKVETSCYNATIFKCIEKNFIPTWKSSRFINIYNTTVYRVSKSLDCESDIKSDHLIKKIISNTMNIDDIGTLPMEKLCPTVNIELKKRITDRHNQQISVKIFTMYQCEKCGRNEVSITRKQLRSQDEGSSTICVCMYCNHLWVLL